MSSSDPVQPSREALLAANIHPETWLATDYLNHFNEVIMLIGLVPDMPDMVADIVGWQRKSYVQHFADSGFAGKALAIEAYEAAPHAVRRPFDAAVADLDDTLEQAIAVLAGSPDPAADVPFLLPDIQQKFSVCAAIINGEPPEGEAADPSHAQGAVDALFAEA